MPGQYVDGNGLRLLVRDSGARFWIFRFKLAGKEAKTREMGLGRAGSEPGAVPLSEARKRAGELHRAVKDGRDPLAERAMAEAERAARAQLDAVRGKTFEDVATAYIEANRAGWGNAKHAAQWTATLKTYAYPVMGKVAVRDVSTDLIVSVLQPLWTTKPETASRVRGRIESVLDFARVRGWRDGENPARWRGHLDHILPRRAKVRAVEHHAALPWKQAGGFMLALAGQKGMATLALRFGVLTAARTGEVLSARWEEIDMTAKLWTVPAERMKGGREHRVPLASAALDVLAEADPNGERAGLVFPSNEATRPLSNMAMTMALRRMGRDDVTVHGMRSMFRDWTAEVTGYSRELAEAALAHAVGDKVEAAYQRGDMLTKRRAMMDDWATFCGAPYAEPAGNVVELRRP